MIPPVDVVAFRAWDNQSMLNTTSDDYSAFRDNADSIFQRTKGFLWVRRIKHGGSVGRARPRFVSAAKDAIQFERRSEEKLTRRKPRVVPINRVRDIVRGVPSIPALSRKETNRLIAERGRDRLFTLLAGKDSFIFEATRSEDALAWTDGLKRVLREYREGASQEVTSLTSYHERSPLGTSHDRIMKVWARFFENCAMRAMDKFGVNDERRDNADVETSVWKTFWDDVHQSNYYYNVCTGEVTWACPDNEVEIVEQTRTSTFDVCGDVNDGEWTMYEDEDTGEDYYYNTSTGETMWAHTDDNIDAMEHHESGSREVEKDSRIARDGWRIRTDEETGQMYYYDAETGESTWHDPYYQRDSDASWEEINKSASSWLLLTDENGNEYYYNPETHESRWESPDEDVEREAGEMRSPSYPWEACEDESGNRFFFNAETNESVWEIPS